MADDPDTGGWTFKEKAGVWAVIAGIVLGAGLIISANMADARLEKQIRERKDAASSSSSGPDLGGYYEPSTDEPTPAADDEGDVDETDVGSDPEKACRGREPDADDIIVRYVNGGTEPPNAQLLGGGWFWDDSTGRCITSYELAVSTNPDLPGYCTEAGSFEDNPGYDPDQVPAPPLVATEQRGDC